MKQSSFRLGVSASVLKENIPALLIRDVYFESFPVDEGSRFLRCVVPGKVEQQVVRLDSVCLGEGAAAFGEFLFLYAHHHYVRSTLGERAAEFKPYSRRASRHERGHSSEVSL